MNNNCIIPIHHNSIHSDRLLNNESLNNFLFPESKKIIVENDYNQLKISKRGMFKRKLTITAINTNRTYTDDEQFLNPQFFLGSAGHYLAKHPQELLYRDERGVFRKILDGITGRKDYDVYIKSSRKEENKLKVITTTKREDFPETKIKTFKAVKDAPSTSECWI